MARLAIYLAVLLSLSPGISRAEDDCSISPMIKKVLLDQARAMPNAEYSNQVRTNAGHMETRFDNSIRVSDLADEEGNLILFRGIQTDYIKGFKGPFAKAEANSNSYSLSPEMAAAWPYGNQIVIAVQNIKRDKLLYPKSDPTAASLRTWNPINAYTRVGDIAHYDEVKVPVDNEKVLVQIDRDQLVEALKQNQGKPYRLRDLIQKLAANKAIKFPNCDESVMPPKSTNADSKVASEGRQAKSPFLRWIGLSSSDDGETSMDQDSAH